MLRISFVPLSVLNFVSFVFNPYTQKNARHFNPQISQINADNNQKNWI